ncbi:peptidoglycan-binding domain-containing protein [Flavobacterium sp.]|uniref:peptidoglycan-binding domain-containing protein n=1 Tax=Flavobacterium sp. TaxID=239 RepID=UPI00391901CF
MKSNNTLLYLGIGTIVVGGIALAVTGKKEPKPTETTETDVLPVSNAPVQPIPLNLKLVLKMGVIGPEVAKLQTLLNVGSDGNFGPITEAALFKLKGVKQTTLEAFSKAPTVNQNRYPVGTKVMANNKNGTPLYNALSKADGSYYSDYEIFTTKKFGEAVGKVRSSNQAGNWYTVYVELWSGTKIFFVKAEDIKNY